MRKRECLHYTLLICLFSILIGHSLLPVASAQEAVPTPTSSLPTATVTAISGPPPTLPLPPGASAEPTDVAPPDTGAPAATDTATHEPDAPEDTSFPTSTSERTPVPTLRPDERPDGAEPNNRRTQARALPLDAVSGPFTFLPEGDQDWYAVDLGAQATGLPLEIAVRGTSGLDLVTTIYRADQWTPLALISSPDISTTLAADLSGWLVFRVDNRSPELASGQSYRIEIRRVLPPPPTPLPVTQPRPTVLPDGLENNWSFATAAPIGVGATYDLTFACPDPRPNACSGGDHDYLRFTVKAGLRYLITTYDLAPGVDTVLDLFFGSETTPIASNDDARPQGGVLSTIRWVAPSDGTAVLRVAPRSGGDAIISFDEHPGSYRLAVVLADTPLARQLEERIAAQTNAPTPTPTATLEPPTPLESGTAESPGGVDAPPPPLAASDLEATESPTGRAIVIASTTALRTAPRADAEVLETAPAETLVTLLGQARGAWVKVETDTGVAPGWALAADLRRVTTTPTVSPTTTTNGADDPAIPTPDAPAVATAAANLPPDEPPAVPADSVRPVVTLDPLPEEPGAALPPREPLVITVTLVAQTAPLSKTPLPGAATPTPAPAPPLADIRVQLVTVFGDLLSDAVSDAQGVVVLTRDLPPQIAVRIRLPAVGIEVPIDRATPTLRIGIPIGALP